METTYSQAAQDLFVLKVLDNKKNGVFVEIGSTHPVIANNTYLLETQYGWTGVMIVCDKQWVPLYKEERPNSDYIIQDAVTVNYNKVLKTYPYDIDYLQINLEVDNMSTLNTLLNLNDSALKTHRFAIITFGHEFYRGDYFRTRDLSRIILKDLGYVLLFPDISWFGCAMYEDWWVHPELVNPQILKKQVYISIPHTSVIKHLDSENDMDDWLSYDTP